MNKFRTIVLAGVIALQTVILGSLALAQEPNLIANPSVETAASSAPANWQSNAWGTNSASFTYSTDNHSGGHSLSVNMSSRTTGDAKWMHDSVNVSANTDYIYTSWYKSSVMTEIDLQYQMTDGSFGYAFVKVLPANADWTELSATFTTPANAIKVRVMHIIAEQGSLQTDDFSLTKTTPVPPVDPPVDPPVTPPVDSSNLIANGSFETGITTPASWSKNAWGTNSNSFVYESTGRTGTRSATTRMLSVSSGDAKWYANPVDVVAGNIYNYSDYYKSDVTTRVVAAFVNAAGTTNYLELPSTAASSTWAQYSTSFTVPSNATQLMIFHFIDKVGYLTLDDVTLTVATTPPPVSSIVPNSSLEIADGTQPADWQISQWGTNSATFSYEPTGRTGNHSVKITMNNYQSGDAKWYFNPVQLSVGQQYRFTTWYKGSVTPQAVAMFIMQDGSEQYFGMPLPQDSSSTTTWQKYSDTFSVPAGAVSSSVFLFINQNGWIQTDDYSVENYQPVGFSRPLLTLTFDDGHEVNATNALPLLNQYGFKTTQCFATTFIEGQSKQVINGVLAFKNSGHETCSHSVTHPFLTRLSTTQVNYELSHSKSYLEKLIGQPVTNFASPYGDYNPQVITEIKKYYASHRSTDEGYNSVDNFSAYNLRVQNILDTTTANQVADWVARAKADNTWLILVYHAIAPNPGPYDTTPTLFAAQLKRIADSGITVKTTRDALSEIAPQL